MSIILPVLQKYPHMDTNAVPIRTRCVLKRIKQIRFHTHVDTYRVYLHPVVVAGQTQYTLYVNNVKDDTTTKRQQHTNNPPTQTSSGKTSTTPHRRTTRMMTPPVVPHTPPEHTRHADQSHKISVTNMYTHAHVK